MKWFTELDSGVYEKGTMPRLLYRLSWFKSFVRGGCVFERDAICTRFFEGFVTSLRWVYL